MSIKIWESNQNTLAEALELPEGRYVADFGINIEQSVEPHHTLEAAKAFVDNGIEIIVASQAQLIVEAQKNQIAFQDWAPLKVW
jgi:hypothetical protein